MPSTIISGEDADPNLITPKYKFGGPEKQHLNVQTATPFHKKTIEIVTCLELSSTDIQDYNVQCTNNIFFPGNRTTRNKLEKKT